jgi:hypothetical protein
LGGGQQGGNGADAPVLRVPPPPASTSAAGAAASAAARVLVTPALPPIGTAVPLVILPVARGSKLHHHHHQNRAAGAVSSSSASAAPRFEAHALPTPGAWVKLRQLALQASPATGGQLQLLFGTPAKLSIVPPPGSAGDGAAPHLESRLAARLAAGDSAAALADAGERAKLWALVPPEEAAKAAKRAQEVREARRAHAEEARRAAEAAVPGGGAGDDEDEGGEGGGSENEPPAASRPAAAKKGRVASQQQQLPTSTPTAITLRQLLSPRERQRAVADAVALAAADAADGVDPSRAYFTRARRVFARVAGLRPSDLVGWAQEIDVEDEEGQQKKQWVVCGRAALDDGTARVEAFVAPETSEQFFGVEAGPLDGRDAASSDRLARMAAAVARLEAVGPPTAVGTGQQGGGEGDDDGCAAAGGEPTGWIEALIMPRVRIPASATGRWRIDYVLTGARMRAAEEEEGEREREQREQQREQLRAAAREAVAAAQAEAAKRRAGSSPVGGGGRRPLPAAEEGGGGKRARAR